ncbi:Nitroreductase family protein [Halolamina pelagica]|uniref:Nitroreductase family protein n=1 Tax=Halolamina pelagica TaxID=699431 RepID=A0A1I5V6L8_9EURY|nr:Nitroreductase family protein [Halolamina pelagica]
MAERDESENRLWATRSTALAGMTLMHAARAEGLATCPVGGFDGEALRGEFDIGDGYEPVMLVTMGHAAANARDTNTPRKFRRSVDDIVHREEFEPAEAELDDGVVAESYATQ